jgi:sigma-B regulation protein RsbU (phosphoserine phosphatase)
MLSRDNFSLDVGVTFPSTELTRLYREARRNELRLQSDLDTAREIQRQLLPKGARLIPGLDLAAACVPARELGGDFYDFLPYGTGRLALVVGDVSGKGTAAALLSSMTIGMLRTHTIDHSSGPAKVLAILNERIHAARLDAHFVAMLFAVYAANTREIKLANAGLPYPTLLREGRAQQVPLPGTPLGLMPGTQYETVSLDLQPGDVFVFTSDGILECEGHGQEAFGAGRLAVTLTSLSSNASSEQISSAILCATDRFSRNPHTPQDDRTILALRVTDETSADLPRVPVVY